MPATFENELGVGPRTEKVRRNRIDVRAEELALKTAEELALEIRAVAQALLTKDRPLYGAYKQIMEVLAGQTKADNFPVGASHDPRAIYDYTAEELEAGKHLDLLSVEAAKQFEAKDAELTKEAEESMQKWKAEQRKAKVERKKRDQLDAALSNLDVDKILEVVDGLKGEFDAIKKNRPSKPSKKSVKPKKKAPKKVRTATAKR